MKTQLMIFIGLFLVTSGQFYTCKIDKECQALGLPSCGRQISHWCDFPSSNKDCAYLGHDSGFHVSFGPLPSIDFCSILCKSDIECSKIAPAANLCSASGYCAECLHPVDCQRRGFKNHICTAGFCQYPGIPGQGQCFSSSAFCAGTRCYDDSVRCWTECQNSEECPAYSSCITGRIIDKPYHGICVPLS